MIFGAIPHPDGAARAPHSIRIDKTLATRKSCAWRMYCVDQKNRLSTPRWIFAGFVGFIPTGCENRQKRDFCYEL
jgi:hypothetical protein